MVLGIDEAGRGPVLGPLVIAIVRWENEWEPDTPPLRDSKKLSAPQRDKLFDQICSRVDYRIHAIPAWVIAHARDTLPKLEAGVIVESLQQMTSDRVLSDRLSAGETIHGWIREHFPDRKLTFETGADDRYPCVSAASILAKVTRDRAMEAHEQRWGTLGSGYPSDPTTCDWLENYGAGQQQWPSFVRTNWSTVERLEAEYNQRQISYESSP